MTFFFLPKKNKKIEDRENETIIFLNYVFLGGGRYKTPHEKNTYDTPFYVFFIFLLELFFYKEFFCVFWLFQFRQNKKTHKPTGLLDKKIGLHDAESAEALLRLLLYGIKNEGVYICPTLNQKKQQTNIFNNPLKSL